MPVALEGYREENDSRMVIHRIRMSSETVLRMGNEPTRVVFHGYARLWEVVRIVPGLIAQGQQLDHAAQASSASPMKSLLST
ncbi:hypothetical protein [Luteibacter sp. E-22]|uniref:hypothetical protein n=1 Tax=Luteibacter sp. E-22 TaxID=3404050 RepID=UPI003CE84609